VSAASGEAGSAGWFCVQTQPKHEHIAAAQLRQDPELEVFLPRIRFQRPTRLGPAWVSEALFPNYLFARFELAACWRRVQSARAVRGLVRFGERCPTIPPATIEELRELLGPEELQVVGSGLRPGETVEIAAGALTGLQAVVTRVMPNAQRVAVLMDFLGRQTSVELAIGQVLPSRGFPQRVVLGV
jgi:transcriptional antiterminator RfaH